MSSFLRSSRRTVVRRTLVALGVVASSLLVASCAQDAPTTPRSTSTAPTFTATGRTNDFIPGPTACNDCTTPSIPVSPPTITLGLTSSLSGSYTTYIGWETSYGVSVSGGTPPYRYIWRVDTTVLQDGTGSGYDYFAYTNQGHDYTVSVQVIDANGLSTGRGIGVTVESNCTPNCW